jgi:hypothetical protein
MRFTRKALGLDQLGAFGFYLAKRQRSLSFIISAYRINYNRYFFAPLQQPQRHCLNGTFSTGANQNKLIGTNLAQQSFYTWLIERVHAPLIENNLPVPTQHINRQISAAVGCKARPIAQQCITYLFLTVSAIKTIIYRAAAVVI